MVGLKHDRVENLKKVHKFVTVIIYYTHINTSTLPICLVTKLVALPDK